MENKNFYMAVALLVGTIVGVGIFGMPYAFSKLGFWPTLVYMIIIAALTYVMFVCYAEVTVRTKGECHQVTKYAELYLGKVGKWFMFFITIISHYAAQILLSIAIGTFLNDTIGLFLGGNSFIYGLVFYIAASIVVLMGLRAVAKTEFFLMFFLLAIVVITFIFALPKINASNFGHVDFSNFFLPYGIILFAFSGVSAIPLVDNFLKKQKQKIGRVCLYAIIVAFAIYLIFTVSILGIMGLQTGQNAVSGLSESNAWMIMILLSIFGIISVTTTFLASGRTICEIYQYDLKMKRFFSWILAFSIPLIIYLLNVLSFIEIMSITGSVLGGLTGIFLILMYRRARKLGQRTPEFSVKIPVFLQYLLMLVFAGGVFYEIFIIFAK